MADVAASLAAVPPPFVVTEPAEPAYVRSPVTVIRLLGALALVAVTSVVLRGAGGGRGPAALADLLATAPRWIVSGVVGVAQLGFAVPAVLGLLGQLALRRFRRVGRLLLAGLVGAAGLLLVSRLVGSSVLPLVPGHHGGGGRGAPGGAGSATSGAAGASGAAGLGPSGYGLGTAFPTNLDLGVIAAWMFVDRAHWSDRWRRVGWIVLGLGVAARVGVGLVVPPTVVVVLATAAAAAALVLVALGSPSTRPRAATVGAILQRLGHEPAEVERFGRFRGFVGFRVALTDGRGLFVKVVSRDSWTALLPVRLYRAARFRDVGQDRPFRSLRTVVEHEALCALKAHSDGVPTARLVVVTEFPPDAMMMAFDARPSVRLDELAPERRSPALFTAVWDIVARLQRSHTVHRRVNADALLVDDEGRVALVEFGAASLGVAGSTLSTDVAEVLAATAAFAGPEVAVAHAVAGVGPAAVAAALPRLQPLALTPRTRAAVKRAGCLDALREEVQRVTGAEAVPVADLERIKLRTLTTVAMAAIALWTLVPQLLGMGSVWGEIRRADMWWAAAALACSAVTYVGAAVALDGSVPEQLPLVPNIGVQFATSFVGVAAPGGALALTARFLQKRGIDTPTAVAAVGIDTIAGGIVHVTLVGLFAVLAGSSGLKTFALPSLTTLGLIAAGVLAVAGAGVAVPWSRVQLRTRVLPATRRSLSSVADVARQPTKLLELFGGSLAITMGYLLALEVAVAAFGPGPAFTSVALVYLVGAAVSSIAPTPGGIGAVEATLIAGLTSAGMAGATALAAVILFRLATFWIPLLPGWGAFTVLQRSGDL